MANIINRAKADFDEFHSLYIKVEQISTAEQEQQVIEMIQLCESAILRSDAWVQEYKGLKCIRLFRPQFRKVKIRFVVEIP